MFVRTYYQVKPWLPSRTRLAVRRWRAERRRHRFAGQWPVDPNAARKPAGWTGWPEGKKFALVVTHDVEGRRGLDQCRALADLERSCSVRSAFNFVPEGEYRVTSELREQLAHEGFEVGVHDLKHDGKLYWSRSAFRRHAERINQYLREWNACGFRSGFMHHNLDWLHDINALYDSSTFDTDPFEPQPDGVHTIYPFWVPRPNSSVSSASRAGYVELPYTLAQDFTLFLLLQERTIDVWKRKLDWIAAHGGMAMLDVHPDYVDFKNAGRPGVSYPATFYREFLEYVQTRYQGQFWLALPRQVAQFARSTLSPVTGVPERPSPVAVESRRKKIWIDLDNTPHVPFFEPIIERLQDRGFDVVLTARDAFQVCELADQKKLCYTRIGHHHGKNKIAKVLGLFYRAAQLAPFALREKPDLSLSHGARSQIILSNLLRIPTVLMADYEFAQYPPLMKPEWEMVPEVIPDSSLCCSKDRIRKYPGIKEDVYVERISLDPDFLPRIGASDHDLLVTVRPPATEAHYHNPESENLFVRFMERACAAEEVRVILLPRNTRQGETIRQAWPHWFEKGKTIIPGTAVDGLNLLWHSDLVVSGGGTMNREAAALGVPVYSIFRGKTGAIDRHLQEEGRLIMVETAEDVNRTIKLVRRPRHGHACVAPRQALSSIVAHLDEIVRHYSNGTRNSLI